jgi:hypothetical protein
MSRCRVDAALAELAYALDVLRLDGVGLLTNYRGAYLGDPRFEPLLAEPVRVRAAGSGTLRHRLPVHAGRVREGEWDRLRRYHAGVPDRLDALAGGNAGQLFPRLLSSGGTRPAGRA